MKTAQLRSGGSVALLLILAVTASTVASASHQNVIVILMDDLAVAPLEQLLEAGLMPNLQTHLIDEGVSFENSFVTNSQCCPSRATLLTGLYSHNHGVFSNSAGLQPGIAYESWFGSGGGPAQEDSTIATALDPNGYHTGFIGKYLTGYGLVAPEGVENPATYVPPGWDDWQGLVDPTTFSMYDYQINDNGNVASYGSAAADYQTDVLSARAVEYIDDRSPQIFGRFFLVVAPFAPHVEGFQSEYGDVLDCTNDYRDLFSLGIRPAPRHEHLADGDPGNGEVPSLPSKSTFNEFDMSDKPTCPETLPPCGQPVDVPTCPRELLRLRDSIDVPGVKLQFKEQQAAMIAVDDMIGAIFDELDASNLLSRTAVVFTSDNGWFYGEHRLSNKSLLYEEAIRVPLVIRAPGLAAGATSSAIVLNNDLAPTIADLADRSLGYEADGMSLVPLLENPDRTDWSRKSFLIEHWFVTSRARVQFATTAGIRRLTGSQDWLYATWHADVTDPGFVSDSEFYVISADPEQEQNRVSLLPAAVEDDLQGYLQSFRTCQGDECRELESRAGIN